MKNKEISAKKYVSQKIYIVNFILISCHIVFSCIFSYFNIDILFYVNLVNITLCLLAFICLKQHKIKQYALIAFIELYIFMLASLFFLGWEMGFQYYCISFTVTIFFCDFYLNKMERVSKNSIAMGIFNMLLYIGFRFWTYNHAPIYVIKNTVVVRGIFLVNTILTFFFVSLYMVIYTTTVCKLEKELRYVAENDSLTGLFNRRKMMEILEEIINSENNKNLVVAMIDIDYFKKVNDSYGHDAGDKVLIKIAEVLKNHNFENSKVSVCRWGGEEFLILNEYDCSKDDIIQVFENLRKTVENCNIEYDNKKIKITITAGISFYQKETSLNLILKKADLLLYKGKELGRNQVIYEKSDLDSCSK